MKVEIIPEMIGNTEKRGKVKFKKVTIRIDNNRKNKYKENNIDYNSYKQINKMLEIRENYNDDYDNKRFRNNI